MRVVLDTSYAVRGPSGTGVYIEQLAAALRDEGVDVIEAADRGRPAPGGGLRRSVSNLVRDSGWTELALAARARSSAADVIHHPLPAHSHLAGCGQVVTVHDLAFVTNPELFDRRYARWAARAHRVAARRADVVIVPSRATQAVLEREWGVTAVVIPHGPGQARGPVERVRAPEHFIYIGDEEPRKDLASLRRAVERVEAAPLVIAGGVAQPVTRAELEGLHARAFALVHPALLEGFGLTVLEAMALGTPVIAARCAAIEELCGGAALLVEPGDPEQLAEAMRSVAADEQLRERLRTDGLDRARAFSWRASARAHLAAYTLAGRR